MTELVTCEHCGEKYDPLDWNGPWGGVPPSHRAVSECRDKIQRERDELRDEVNALRAWDDVEDEWSEAIDQAFPTRSGSHDQYAMAMKMVGNRYSKGELVALVNWLLVRLDT